MRSMRVNAHLDLSRLSIDVKAHVLVSLAVGGVQFTDDLLRLDAGVLSENPWNDLQRLPELVDAVLL